MDIVFFYTGNHNSSSNLFQANHMLMSKTVKEGASLAQ